jgi:hypothetical protein
VSEITEVDLNGLRVLRDEIPEVFEGWERIVPPGMAEQARDIFLGLISELIRLGPKPLVMDVLHAFQKGIEALNFLHNMNRFWIATGERDEIGLLLERIISLVNLEHREELEDGTIWRDW